MKNCAVRCRRAFESATVDAFRLKDYPDNTALGENIYGYTERSILRSKGCHEYNSSDFSDGEFLS
jgi:hypothetical protein